MPTVTKALSLLQHFSRARPLIGLSDMARLSGLNKATAHRMLTELQAAGFVEQAEAGREYRLGPALIRLAALREQAVPLRDVAGDVLRALSDATQETAHFSILQGDVLLATAHAYSPLHGTRVTMEDAQELMLHATSSGLAVLAYSPADFVDQLLAGPLAARTPQTVTDPAAIRAALARVRATGIAVSVSGFEMDVHSHAAPVFDAKGRAMGALAVAAPVARMDAAVAAEVQAAVFAAGSRLTRLLGGFPPADYPTALPTPTPAAAGAAPDTGDKA